MANSNINWTNTCQRFVAFIDIMGFRERVYRSTHKSVLKSMESFVTEAIKPMQLDAAISMKKTRDPYTSEKRKTGYEAKGIKWCVNRKGCRHYQLSPEDVAYNHKQSQTRAKGEHAFRVVKYLWHYQ